MTEINIRLNLPYDYLYKVDMASMHEALEVRVPMLDEDLVTFGISLPHAFKVRFGRCKRVLREVAERRLPKAVARKKKSGFAIPVDRWVEKDFKDMLQDVFITGQPFSADVLNANVFRGWIRAFVDGTQVPGISRQGLYQRIIMLLALELFFGKVGA